MTDDDFRGVGGVSRIMTAVHKKNSVCTKVDDIGGRGVSQIMTVDDIGGGGVAYLVS